MELLAEVDDDDVLVLPFLLPLLFLAALDDSVPLLPPPPLEGEAGEPPPLLFTEGLMVVNVAVGSMKMSKGRGQGPCGHSKCVALGEVKSAKFLQAT